MRTLDILYHGGESRDRRLGGRISVTFAGSNFPEELNGNWILDYQGVGQKSPMKKVSRPGKALENSLIRGVFYASKGTTERAEIKINTCGDEFPVRLSSKGILPEIEGVFYCEPKSFSLFGGKNYYFKENI